MGSGEWLTDVHTERMRAKAASGKSVFDYDATLRSKPRSSWAVHPTLDPNGVKFRESRDSDEHPRSRAIGVKFDVTGSMGEIPRVFQGKLKELHGLLQRKGYIEHPQIMFGAIGDATCDRLPYQIGQFESDNRMDENLENIVLEGGGGGQMTESYELDMYFMARHTDIDCWNKRKQKGYNFMIGDEMAYPRVKRNEVRSVIGDILQSDVSLETIVEELKQRYETYYILPRGASYGGNTEVLGFWKRLLGQNVIELDDPTAVCETIALQIGINEGTTDLDAGVRDLEDFGVDKSTRLAVRKALSGKSGPPVRGTRSLPGLSSKSLKPGTP
jgi:hypothetical protein